MRKCFYVDANLLNDLQVLSNYGETTHELNIHQQVRFQFIRCNLSCELFEMMGLSDRWRVCKWIADLISCWVYYTFTCSCLRRVDRVMYRFIALAQGPMQRQITLTLHSISMSQTSLINEHWHWDSSVSDHVELLAAFNVVLIHQVARHMSITRAQLTTRASPFMRRWRSTIRQEWIGTLTPAVWHKHGCLEHLFLALNALCQVSVYTVEEVKRKP